MTREIDDLRRQLAASEARIRRLLVTVDNLKELAVESVEWEAVSDAMQHMTVEDRNLMDAVPNVGYHDILRWLVTRTINPAPVTEGATE